MQLLLYRTLITFRFKLKCWQEIKCEGNGDAHDTALCCEKHRQEDILPGNLTPLKVCDGFLLAINSRKSAEQLSKHYYASAARFGDVEMSQRT